MNPINDLCKVELETDSFGFGGETSDKADSGILISLADELPYFGFWSFAFDNSLGNVNPKVYEYYKDKIGKRVYWTALSEKGNVIEVDDKKYAFIKLTSLIAWSDPEVKGQQVGDGQFKA